MADIHTQTQAQAQTYTSVSRTGNVTIGSLSFCPNILPFFSRSLGFLWSICWWHCSGCPCSSFGGPNGLSLRFELAGPAPLPLSIYLSAPLSTPLSLSIIGAHNLPTPLKDLMRVLVGTSLSQRTCPILTNFPIDGEALNSSLAAPLFSAFVTQPNA